MPIQPAVEQLLLGHGTRGIERLARYLPADYAAQAARALWQIPQVIITTGFYVDGHPETDGPPGAFFLGRALATNGTNVCYVGEPDVLSMLRQMAEELWFSQTSTPRSDTINEPDFIEFPIADTAASRALSRDIILNQQPSAIVSIERCGRTISGHYRNMLGIDIAQYTAQVDELFSQPAGHPHVTTVGIGDGGNEIGMGLLVEHIPDALGITDPVETGVDHLVLATVSNWGAYGIVAYLSHLAGQDLLPAEGEEAKALEGMVAHGAIDGLTHQAEQSVDGFPLDVTSALVAALRRVPR
jgi:hypothetical protein